MNYTEAIDFLKARTKFGINLGLDRIRELLKRMGNPHMQGIKFVHITGTNGKGSTSAMLASILKAAGNRTGFFSSPHLHSYCERFRIDGELISEEELAQILTELAPHLLQMEQEGFEPPTEFEVSTAIALCWFAKKKVDYAVMEVGMGGSIDSTNVIPAKTQIITSVALDHVDYLGHKLAEIAEVKAGIIKQGAAVFTPCSGEALQVIRAKAKQMGAAVFTLPQDFSYRIKFHSIGGQCIDFMGEQVIEDIYLPLLGAHQAQNCALAIAAALHLCIDDRSIRHGIIDTQWYGRLELLCNKPTILIDGAHNVEGMQVLSKALSDYFPDKRIIAVLGMLADKEREESMHVLLPHISQAVFTRPPNERAKDWQRLAESAKAYQIPYECIESIDEAVGKAMAMQGQDDLLLVAGSLYLVAEARAYLLEVLI